MSRSGLCPAPGTPRVGNGSDSMANRLLTWLTGKNTEASRAYDFIAEPPIWQRGWFILTMIFLVVIFGLLLLMYWK